MRKKRNEQKPRPESLRAMSRRLFPLATRSQRARWVVAKQYVLGRRHLEIGEKHIDDSLPDFLRRLPDGPELVVVENVQDHIRRKAMKLRRMFTG